MKTENQDIRVKATQLVFLSLWGGTVIGTILEVFGVSNLTGNQFGFCITTGLGIGGVVGIILMCGAMLVEIRFAQWFRKEDKA